jgi:GntR family transcriptional regulator/MocR family aminotransferase
LSKSKSALEIPVGARPEGKPLTDWLYEELRQAILDGRLAAATRLPATRDFAAHHGVSRGTLVQVFERLQVEGYLHSRVGAGTWVSGGAAAMPRPAAQTDQSPAYLRRAMALYKRPKAFAGLSLSGPPRPFHMGDVDFAAFPAALWSKLASQRGRGGAALFESQRDARGYRPLRQAVAQYLGSARGVPCEADQVVVTSGVQQGLDLIARTLLRPGDKVCMEDPGYFGARLAFETAGAQIVPLPLDAEGVQVGGRKPAASGALGIYVTPAHQFPMGMTMSLGRRMELLEHASSAGMFIIEDDYDSEYRFEGRPIPALMSIDRRATVILVGSFSKVMFPALRIGYIVAPQPLANVLVAFRIRTDLHPVHFDQAVLCDFIERGYLARHVRRMREIYAARHSALIQAAERYLSGALEVRGVHCGLYTGARLVNGLSSDDAEKLASARGVETLSMNRYTLAAPDPKGLLLGFASFNETSIREGVRKLAKALT